MSLSRPAVSEPSPAPLRRDARRTAEGHLCRLAWHHPDWAIPPQTRARIKPPVAAVAYVPAGGAGAEGLCPSERRRINQTMPPTTTAPARIAKAIQPHWVLLVSA